MLNNVASCMQPPLLYITATSQTHSQSQAHSRCDVTNVMSSATGRATVSHLAIILVYIEFAWNYAGFDSNYYYFTRLTPIVEETLTSGKYVSLFLIWIIYIYTYIKVKKLHDNPHIFWRNNTKNGNQRKLRKWREQMHPFCCYSSSEHINCHSIQAARKKYPNNIKRALDFYYYSPFLHGNISVCKTWHARNS